MKLKSLVTFISISIFLFCVFFFGNTNVFGSSEENKIQNVKSIDTSKYAMIYFYRPKKWKFQLNSYSVNVGDSTFVKVKNNSKHVFKVYKEGSSEIWAQIGDKKSSISLNIKFGQEYYIKCSFTQGFSMNYPELLLMSRGEGKEESDLISESN